MESEKILVNGIVQGVGYRAFVKGIALSLNIKGYAKNMPEGSVEIVAQGTAEELKEFEKRINIDTQHGPQVHNIKISKNANTAEYDSFNSL